jgi:RND family efflux transporter MFP subunit
MGATNRFLGGLLVVGTAAVLAGCNRGQPVVEPPPVEVVIAQPVKDKVVDWDTYTGDVKSKDAVDVRARVKGEIKDVPFKHKKEGGKEVNLEGKDIKAGELLFVIDDVPFQADKQKAEGQLEVWTAKRDAAEKIIKIYDPLAKQGTVSAEELVKAIGNKGEAVGGITAAKGAILDAEANIKYCKITSPITGRIGEARFTTGNMVSGQNDLLTTVVRVDELYVDFYVNERALITYKQVVGRALEKEGRKLEEVKIPVEMALVTDTKFPHKGMVEFIDNKVDPKTGSVKVGARFDNPLGKDGLRPLTPGMFARVRVAIADPYPAVLVPDRAILTDQNLKYVLVVNKAKNNAVERVDVTVSSRVQENGLRVVKGLEGDEWVIVDGVNRARAGVTVNPKEGRAVAEETKKK